MLIIDRFVRNMQQFMQQLLIIHVNVCLFYVSIIDLRSYKKPTIHSLQSFCNASMYEWGLNDRRSNYYWTIFSRSVNKYVITQQLLPARKGQYGSLKALLERC